MGNFLFTKISKKNDDWLLKTGHTISRANASVGFLNYMSPEQIQESLVDTRSDIWSLGILSYFLASGKQPFTQKNAFQLMKAITTKSELILNFPKSISVEFQMIIKKCLQHEKEQRFQTIGEVEGSLLSVKSQLI